MAKEMNSADWLGRWRKDIDYVLTETGLHGPTSTLINHLYKCLTPRMSTGEAIRKYLPHMNLLPCYLKQV